MNFTLKVWRQKNAKDKGHFETYKVENISADSSFLEMMDILNEQVIREGNNPVALNKGCHGSGPVAFDHDCREGICGMCSLYINGHPHGPDSEITTCQLHMRKFKDGDTITIEPWRSAGFPIIKDLVVDRTAFDKPGCWYKHQIPIRPFWQPYSWHDVQPQLYLEVEEPKNLLLQQRTTLQNRFYKLLHKHRNLRKMQRPYFRQHLS